MNASTVTTPRCDATVFLAIQEHACSETDHEVGGVLVGHIDGSAVIPASIPALQAVGGSANVTFTREVWEEALTIVDRDHPGERIVGWYHSHPGFGVFLSEYDEFIQRNFGGEGMVALVIDPLGGEGGWFVSVGDDIEELPTFATRSVSRPASGASAAAASRGGVARRSQALLYGAVAGVAAFATGWFLAPDESATSPTATDREVAALEAERDALREALEDATTGTTIPADEPASAPPPSTPWDLRYVVRPGDSITLLAQRYYGTSEAVPEIVAANPAHRRPRPDLGRRRADPAGRAGSRRRRLAGAQRRDGGVTARARCPYHQSRSDLDDSVRCPGCGAIGHRDCWQEYEAARSPGARRPP